MSKPQYTTRELADLWGVTTEFVRQQVRDGKLRATVRLRQGLRTVYRFTEDDVAAYDPDPETVLRLRAMFHGEPSQQSQ